MHKYLPLILLVLFYLLIIGLIRMYRRGGRGRAGAGKANPILQRAREHLEAMRGASFRAKPLGNNLEKTAYQTALGIVQKRGQGEHVLLQVSLGEILQSKDRRAYWAVNSKRVDLLVSDRELRPLGVSESDGSGHGLSREIARINDKIKDTALRAADIPLIRIPAPDDDLGLIRALVHKRLTACLARRRA